jgi:hypothetical protein
MAHSHAHPHGKATGKILLASLVVTLVFVAVEAGRGQNQRRPSSGNALGPAYARLQDPQQQAHQQVHRDAEGQKEIIHGTLTP